MRSLFSLLLVFCFIGTASATNCAQRIRVQKVVKNDYQVVQQVVQSQYPVVQQIERIYVPQNLYTEYVQVPDLIRVEQQYVARQREFVAVPSRRRSVRTNVNVNVGGRRSVTKLRVVDR